MPWADANEPFFYEDAAYLGLKCDVAKLVTPHIGDKLSVLDTIANTHGPFAHVIRFGSVFSSDYPMFARYLREYKYFTNDMDYRRALIPALMKESYFWTLVIVHAWILANSFHVDAGRAGQLKLYANLSNENADWSSLASLRINPPFDNVEAWRNSVKPGNLISGAARLYGRLMDDTWQHSLFNLPGPMDVARDKLLAALKCVSLYGKRAVTDQETSFYRTLSATHRQYFAGARPNISENTKRRRAVTTFQQQFGNPPTLVDDRAGIGPHHLAIGKTRKIFEKDNTIYAFFSRGYEIACSTFDADTLQLLGSQVLDCPVAWGGGAFCVDCDASGRVALVFLHRNKHELCLATGTIEHGTIRWAPWRSLLVSAAHQAAPWVEMGLDGTAWCSVLDRTGDFRIAVVRGADVRVGDLFSDKEEPWYHSCVQVCPVGNDRAVAIGFRGTFPTRTELVFKSVSADLKFGPSETLAPCNVNDRLTFHFQAVGDPARGTAHIVYLDDALTVSHAYLRTAGGRWPNA